MPEDWEGMKERFGERLDRLTSPRSRGFWIVALVLFVAGGSWGTYEVRRLMWEAERERATSDLLATVNAALRTNLNRARAAADSSEALLARTVVEMAAVRDTARQERARARAAGSALRDRARAAAGDSAAVVALVDSIEVEHAAEVGAVETELAAADSTIVVQAERILTLEVALVIADSVIANRDAAVASITLQRDLFEAAAERASSPGLFVSVRRGAPWLVAGMGLGFVLAR